MWICVQKHPQTHTGKQTLTVREVKVKHMPPKPLNVKAIKISTESSGREENEDHNDDELHETLTDVIPTDRYETHGYHGYSVSLFVRLNLFLAF